MRRIHTLVVFLLLLGGFSAGSTYGQGGATGAISGSVVDSSGSAVSGAEVQIISSSTQEVVR